MNNSIGDRLRLTVFGQSHAPGVGAVLEGFECGFTPDWERVNAFLRRRAPGAFAGSTARRETDEYEILSGLNAAGSLCDAPLTVYFRNRDAKSADYDALRDLPRPGHADWAARLKYGAAADLRGGGQYSGRLTAPVCFAGALCLQWLEKRGVRVGAHILSAGAIRDREADEIRPALPFYADGDFPCADPAAAERMQSEIAALNGDSMGGEIEIAADGVPAGLGGALFGGAEGTIARYLFAVPAVKGVRFGRTAARGSENNDAIAAENGRTVSLTNHAGGILGGITTGMPLLVKIEVKPTPSIGLPQRSADLKTGEERVLTLAGRHDACILPRAVPVAEAMTALALTDMMLTEGIGNE